MGAHSAAGSAQSPRHQAGTRAATVQSVLIFILDRTSGKRRPKGQEPHLWRKCGRQVGGWALDVEPGALAPAEYPVFLLVQEVQASTPSRVPGQARQICSCTVLTRVTAQSHGPRPHHGADPAEGTSGQQAVLTPFLTEFLAPPGPAPNSKQGKPTASRSHAHGGPTTTSPRSRKLGSLSSATLGGAEVGRGCRLDDNPQPLPLPKKPSASAREAFGDMLGGEGASPLNLEWTSP